MSPDRNKIGETKVTDQATTMKEWDEAFEKTRQKHPEIWAKIMVGAPQFSEEERYKIAHQIVGQDAEIIHLVTIGRLWMISFVQNGLAQFERVFRKDDGTMVRQQDLLRPTGKDQYGPDVIELVKR